MGPRLSSKTPAAATNLVPSDEDAMQEKAALGALVNCQVNPEFVEVAILPWAAANLVPSHEQQTEIAFGPLVKYVQFAPAFVEVESAEGGGPG